MHGVVNDQLEQYIIVTPRRRDAAFAIHVQLIISGGPNNKAKEYMLLNGQLEKEKSIFCF